MRRFLVLVRKEIRELLTPQMLVPLLMIVAVFMFIGNVVEGEMDQEDAAQRVGVIDLDGSELSARMTGVLSESGFQVVDLESADAERIAEELLARDLTYGLIVPEGFESSVQSGQVATVETYGVVRSFSFAALGQAEALNRVVSAVSESVSVQLVSQGMPGVDPAVVNQPVQNVEHVVVGESEAQVPVSAVYGFITNQTTLIPIVLFIVIVFASQMIATTIASEKENKTLETLLASPVSRTSLVMSKMVAAGTVALASAAAYMVGLNSYMTGLTGGAVGGPFGGAEGTSSAIEALGLGLSTIDWLLLGATLFVSILVALSLSVILGAFAENVKAVQSLLGPLMILVLIPYFLTMLTDIESASPALRTFVMAIPFAHAFTAAPNLFLGRYSAVVLGIAYQALWLAGLVFAAARIFASDRILTMKLSLRRSRT